jgi:protein gp37
VSTNSKIEWTDATVNPIRARDIGKFGTGHVGWFCEKISPGCANCYASKMNTWRGNGYEFLPEFANRVELFLDEKTLDSVLHWKKPRKIFWCDMTDMFQDAVKDEWLDAIFRVMAKTPQHTHQVLTKRPARMRNYMPRWKPVGMILPNVWLGVSVENQHFADERIPLLLQTPAAKRFISAEPLLDQVNLLNITVCKSYSDKPITLNALRAEVCPRDNSSFTHPALDWVIVGGESGPGARMFNVFWATILRLQCKAAGVPFFVKQLGGNALDRFAGFYEFSDKKGGDPSEWPPDLRVREFPQ